MRLRHLATRQTRCRRKRVGTAAIHNLPHSRPAGSSLVFWLRRVGHSGIGQSSADLVPEASSVIVLSLP
jgi:hypothetical protein